MIESFIKKNNIEYYKDASLKKYNTYKINSKCKYLIFPKNKKEVVNLIRFLKDNKNDYILLGNGSNIILAKEYYDKVIIKLDRLNKLTRNEDTLIVESGYSLIKLATEAAIMGLSGLEFASGIPGSIGASVAMNAGAYNHSLGEIIESVEVLTPKYEIKKMYPKDINFNYRNSFFKENKDYIILSCKIKLVPGSRDEIIEVMKKRKERRLETQPLDYPSAGSVFRNPENLHAGALIEECGLKGYQIGGAMVSKKHANFIINYNNASGEDIIKLINYTKERVFEKYKIELNLEQIIID